jgi:hypothetical protein
LLVHEPAADLAVDEILTDPALHAEIRAALPVLQTYAEPCGGEAVVRIVGKLFAVYPQPDRGPAEWTAFWEAYTDDLADMPPDALEAAVKEYRRGAKSEFLPKPGPLRALALKHAEPIWKAVHRAKRAANSLPRPARGANPEFRDLMAKLSTELRRTPIEKGEQ